MGRLTRRIAPTAVIAMTVLLGLGAPALARSVAPPHPSATTPPTAATFEAPQATAVFATSVTFEQRIRGLDRPGRAEILLEFQGALGPHVVEVPVPSPSGGVVTLRHVLGLADGHIVPNTPIAARWRITNADGTIEIGPRATVLYEDTRFAWKSRVGEHVRVHWYMGSNAFGQRALDIGERAVAEASALLGVEESETIDVFIYAERDAFYDAIGPGQRENVGGQANVEIRTLFALITPAAIGQGWVGIVIPHELTHLVFDTAVDNPYHYPPRWLNEGVAVYQSEGYAAIDRSLVEDAARRDLLVPLRGLTGQFPTTRDEFFLAYAESISAVDFMVATYGRDALIDLIRSYAEGRTDDEAFTSALGVDVAAFDAAWRESLGAAPAIEHGPQPAPAGPVPPGWDVPVVVGGGSSPAPGASSGPGGPGASGGEGPMASIGAGIAVGLIAGLGLVLLLVGLRRRQGGGA